MQMINIKQPILLSGIQPSGELTIGSYIGAIQQWVHLQHNYRCLFLMVDLHTLTVRQNPAQLRSRCYDFLALYLACGIDPEKHLLFLQSQVPAHTQLAWILNCYTAMGDLNRMTQFKDKSQRHHQNINAGLFDYPVLMAADILLYGTQRVPVGEDQRQHLELTRNIALRFNQIYGDILVIPEAYIPQQGARIMSLQNPLQKMSKSDPNPNNYITLLDNPDTILQKLKRSVTDSGSDIRFDVKEKPGISNLLTLFSAMSGQSTADLELQYQGKGYGTFKQAVADAIVSHLSPIQIAYAELRKDETHLQSLLHRGAEGAKALAAPLLQRVHEALGLIV